MDNLSHFQSLEEMIRALDRERKLLHALFQDRKKLSFRYDLARDLASKKDESIEFLRRYSVIRENADFVELEDVYLKFFEDVLEVNEEINIASVKESIGNLNNAIDYSSFASRVSNLLYSFLSRKYVSTFHHRVWF